MEGKSVMDIQEIAEMAQAPLLEVIERTSHLYIFEKDKFLPMGAWAALLIRALWDREIGAEVWMLAERLCELEEQAVVALSEMDALMHEGYDQMACELLRRVRAGDIEGAKMALDRYLLRVRQALIASIPCAKAGKAVRMADLVEAVRAYREHNKQPMIDMEELEEYACRQLCEVDPCTYP